jgi:hypothetical protein
VFCVFVFFMYCFSPSIKLFISACVQFYRPLRLGLNPIAVNKYHIICGLLLIALEFLLFSYLPDLLCRSQWPSGSEAARLLRLRVRITLGAWTSVCRECCVLSGRGLCDELIPRPEESYRLWWVVVRSRNLANEEALAQWWAVAQKKVGSFMLLLYCILIFYDILLTSCTDRFNMKNLIFLTEYLFFNLTVTTLKLVYYVTKSR